MPNRPDFRGDWSKDIRYKKGDIVYYFNGTHGDFYEALLEGVLGTAPGSGAWRPIGGTILTNPADAWNAAITYAGGDLVTHNGGVYMAILGSIDVPPPNPTFWQPIVTGGSLSAHAIEHVNGSDQIPTATSVTRGLMDSVHVNTLDTLNTRVGDLETPATGSTTLTTLETIPNNTLLGNDSGGAASPEALTVSEVVALLGLSDTSGMGVVTTIGNPGSDVQIATEQAIREAIDTALVTGASDIYEEVADTTALKAVDMTTQSTPAIGFVTGTGLYFYDPDSTLTENIPSVVTPTTGGGRWVRTSTPLTNHDSLTNITGDGPEYNHLTDLQVAKLAGIEDGATADMTGAEIKVAYEAEADTNAFSDAYKAQLDNLNVSGAIDLDALDTQVATNVTNIATNASDLSTHIGDTANPHAVSKDQVGLSNVQNILHNYTASAAPTAGDDSGDGYAKGSMWIYGTEAWYCADATVGAAVWTRLTAESADQLDGEDGAYYLNRVNHTGTQSASTISDFTAAVITALTGTSVTVHNDVTNAGSGSIITSAERAKLAGIETGATADQSASEIKSLYESNADTNAFTDSLKSKLEGLSASPGDMAAATYDPNAVGADVFDPANHIYDNATSGLTATDVQAAIDELAGAATGPGGGNEFVQFNDNGSFEATNLRYRAGQGSRSLGEFVTSSDLDLSGGMLDGYFDRKSVNHSPAGPDFNISARHYKDIEMTATSDLNIVITDRPGVAGVAVCTLIINNGGAHTITWPAGAVWMTPEPTLQTSGKDVVTMRITDTATLLFHSGSSS